jgi:capsular exopolysaccharide synthesis family protein
LSDEFEPIQESQGQALDLTRLLEAGKRRRVSITIATALALIPGLLVPFQPPDYYEATATVSIQGTPEIMDLGAEYMPSPQASQQFKAIAAVASSDTVLGRVVDQWPPSRRKQAWPRLRELRAWLGSWSARPQPTAQQQRQLRIGSLRSSLSFALTGAGTVLEVTATSRNAEAAAALANSVADAYLGYRRNMREAALARATAWLDQNLSEVRRQIQSGEAAIASHVAKEGILLSGAQQVGNDSRADLSGQLRTARIELMTTRQRLAELGPGTAVRGLSEASSQRHALLQEQLAGARGELEAARLRYTPTHPEVARLETTVASLESKLKALGGEPLGADQIRDYRALQSQEADLRARVAVLERALREYSEREGPGAPALAAYERMQRELAIDQQLLEMLLRRHDEATLAAATAHPDARLLDQAFVPIGPAGPDRKKLLLAGVGLALGFGFGIGALREMLDRRVHDPEEAAELLGVPLLGAIPRTHGSSLLAASEGGEEHDSRAAESYRNLRTALLFSTRASEVEGDSKLGTLVVTSGIAGEGKTTFSANLAECFAQVGWRVLLVDADLRRSRVHRLFDLERSPGLSDLLRGELGLDDVVRDLWGVGFDVITAGEMPSNPSELLTNQRLDRLRPEVRKRYDLIVIDSPVLLSVPDALLLAARGDATLLIHKPGSLERSAFTRMRSDLTRAGARVLGVVFTQVPTGDPYLYPRYLESPYVEARQPLWRRVLRRRSAVGKTDRFR